MLVSQAVGETLRRFGVDTAFGLIGSGNFAIVTHMTRRCGIRYYACRHELGAIVMADAYARVTGRVGVCTVHQGPGLTNTMTGLVEATKSRTPLLVVAGDTASTARGGNLDIDQDTLVRSIGAGVHRVRGAELAVEDVALAVRRARAERRPIVLSLPIDLQEQDCPGPDQVEPSLGPPLPPVRPHDEAVSGVVDLLARSSRPLIIAGRGAVRADARQPLEQLGDRAGAILATAAVAHGLSA